MNEYKIIELNNPAVVCIKADKWELVNEMNAPTDKRLIFYKGNRIVAAFNWSNIAGVMEVKQWT